MWARVHLMSVNWLSSYSFFYHLCAFLETGGELESKCVPRLFLGSLLGRVSRLLPVGQHFPLRPVTAPVVFAKVSSAQFTSRFKSGKLEKVFAMCFKLIVLLAAPKENYSLKESYHNGCVYDATSMKVKENRTPWLLGSLREQFREENNYYQPFWMFNKNS